MAFEESVKGSCCFITVLVVSVLNLVSAVINMLAPGGLVNGIIQIFVSIWWILISFKFKSIKYKEEGEKLIAEYDGETPVAALDNEWLMCKQGKVEYELADIDTVQPSGFCGKWCTWLIELNCCCCAFPVCSCARPFAICFGPDGGCAFQNDKATITLKKSYMFCFCCPYKNVVLSTGKYDEMAQMLVTKGAKKEGGAGASSNTTQKDEEQPATATNQEETNDANQQNDGGNNEQAQA